MLPSVAAAALAAAALGAWGGREAGPEATLLLSLLFLDTESMSVTEVTSVISASLDITDSDPEDFRLMDPVESAASSLPVSSSSEDGDRRLMKFSGGSPLETEIMRL